MHGDFSSQYTFNQHHHRLHLLRIGLPFCE
jgi:hypothetical protein